MWKRLVWIASVLIAFAALAVPVSVSAATLCACFFRTPTEQVCDPIPDSTQNQDQCSQLCAEAADAAPEETQLVNSRFAGPSAGAVADLNAECSAYDQSVASAPGQGAGAGETAQPSPIEFTRPTLAVPIPGVSFSAPLQRGNRLTIPFLGEYLSGVYKFLLGASLTIAIVMVMVGGVQYVVSGATGEVQAAKERIKNAVMGLVLLFSAYVILYTVNPQLTILRGIEIELVNRVLNETTAGEEGAPGGAAASTCQQAVANARQNGTCKMTGGTGSFASPISGTFSCNYHFREKEYDYTKINALDYPAGWGTEILAPFAGTVSYTIGTTSNRCGNTIKLTGQGTNIFICHAKDFLDANGAARAGATLQVEQGDVIGHVGGRCCAGETAPSGWSQGDKCTFQNANPCTNPFTNQANCSCQPIALSGNTSGPHVHVTFNRASGGDLLACHR